MEDTEKEAALPEEQETETPAVSEVDETEAKAGETEAKAEETEEEKPKRRPRRSYNQRIAQMTARQRELEREIERLKAPAEQEVAKAPKREDFEDYEDYLDARAEWKAVSAAEKRLAERQEKAAAQAQEREAQAAAESFQNTRMDTIEKGVEAFEDFEDVALQEDLPITEVMADALLQSKKGHELWYHLGKNPDTALDIAQLPPIQQAIELGRLEATLAPAKKPSEAPAPIKAPAQRGSSSNSLRDNLSTAEWIKRRSEEVRKAS